MRIGVETMNCVSDGTANRRRSFMYAVSITGLVLFFAVSSFAVSASADSHGGWKSNAWIGFEGQGETDVDVAGDFDFWMINGGIASSKKINDSLVMTPRADYRVVSYDFSGADSFDAIHVVRINPTMTYLIDEKWSIIGGPSLQISLESGATIGDAIAGGGTLGAGYKVSDSLSLAFGVVVTTQIEDDVWVQPFAIVNWGITDELSLGVEARNSRGGEVKLAYALGDDWKLGVGFGFRRERFRLDDSGAIDEGVGEEESTVVNLSVAYRINADLAVEAYGGTTLDGELRLEDEDGDLIGKSDYDNAGYGGVRLKFAF
jgi:hypothetical protein